MGHRVSANLFRLGRQRTWNSQWFAKSEYTYLLSLDYRIRDFIDYIFYNLKWPASELQIKRFVSRNVILEVMLVVPNDRLVQYLESIQFLKTHSIADRVDPYKFNTLALDFNYVVWNMSYSLLNKSVFYLLLRAIKISLRYDRISALYTYCKLYNLVSVNLKSRSYHKYYSARKCKLLYRYCFRTNIFDKFLVTKLRSLRHRGYLKNKFKKKPFYRGGYFKKTKKVYQNKLPTNRLYERKFFVANSVSRKNQVKNHFQKRSFTGDTRRNYSYEREKERFNELHYVNVPFNSERPKGNVNRRSNNSQFINKRYDNKQIQIKNDQMSHTNFYANKQFGNKPIGGKYSDKKQSSSEYYIDKSFKTKQFVDKQYGRLDNVSFNKYGQFHKESRSKPNFLVAKSIKKGPFKNNLSVRRKQFDRIQYSGKRKTYAKKYSHRKFNIYKNFEYLLYNLLGLLVISSDVVRLGSMWRYVRFLRCIRLLRRLFRRNLNSVFRAYRNNNNSHMFDRSSKDLFSYLLSYYGYDKNGLLSKYYRYTKRSYYPFVRSIKKNKRKHTMLSRTSKAAKRVDGVSIGMRSRKKGIRSSKNFMCFRKKRFLKRSKRRRRRLFQIAILKPKLRIQRNRKRIMDLYLANDLLFSRKFNFRNRIPNGIWKRAIFGWLVRKLHTCTEYSTHVIKKSRYVNIIYKFLSNRTVHKRRRYFALSQRFSRLKAKKRLFARFSIAAKRINYMKAISISKTTTRLYEPLKFFFNFNNLWHFYSSTYWLHKILLSNKDRKTHAYNKFYTVYSNFHSLIILRKFVNFFNFFKFENFICEPIKLLRYYTRFIVCERRQFRAFRGIKKTIFFLLYMHSYIVQRFSYMQLFLHNLLNGNMFTVGCCTVNSIYQSRICVFLFLYYFVNHLKLVSITIRILQLVNISTVCDEVVFFFCKIFSVLHFINPGRYPSDVRYYFKCFSKYIKPKLKSSIFPLQIRDRRPERLERHKLAHSVFLVDRKSNIISGRPDFDGSYILMNKLSAVQNALLGVFCSSLSTVRYLDGFNFSKNLFFVSFLKILPGFIKYPYFLLKRGNEIRSVYKNHALKNVYLRCIPRYLASVQMRNLMMRKHTFFFRYVVDRLLFRFDVLRRDILPSRTLRFLSLMIEYSLSSYLSNKVLFLPIYYLGKKLPVKQARIVCLYISYELEKGIPYFLIVKYLGLADGYVSKRYNRRYFKGFNNIFYYGISRLDKHLLSTATYEFNKYRLGLQSKSIMKYFLFRTFRSVSLLRGFTRRLGVRIACSGRMHRRHTRSHTMWFVRGAMPLRIFDKYIDYYSSYAVTNLGTVGVKTWIYLTQFSSLGYKS